MEGIARIERAVKFTSTIVSIAVCALVLYGIAKMVGTENVWMVLIAAVAVFVLYRGMRRAWRRLYSDEHCPRG